MTSEDAIRYLEMCREDRAERCNTENTLSVEAYDIAIRHIQAWDKVKEEIKKLQKKLKITIEDKYDIVHAIHELISRL